MYIDTPTMELHNYCILTLEYSLPVQLAQKLPFLVTILNIPIT